MPRHSGPALTPQALAGSLGAAVIAALALFAACGPAAAAPAATLLIRGGKVVDPAGEGAPVAAELDRLRKLDR
jgi:hypothetical protein